MKQTKVRDTGIDITRIIAFVCVPCVHFFLHTGFYSRTVNCSRMYLMVSMRSVFMICVPLFMIITGFLMSKKEIRLDRESLLSFYSKAVRIIVLYSLATIMTSIFSAIYSNSLITIKSVILDIVGFRTGYSWYVEMYLGMFLLIPLLNTLWNAAGDKTARTCIVAVLVIITAAPGILNSWDLSSIGTIIRPWMGTQNNKIVTQWWEVLYPFTYYYIGAYIRTDVDVKSMKRSRLLGLFVLSSAVFSAFNVWRSYGTHFTDGAWQTWGGIQNVVDATLAFLLVNSFDYSKIPETAASIISRIANLTFAAYILSMIPDVLIYGWLNEMVPKVTMRINYFPLTVFASVTIALLLSALVQVAYNVLYSLCHRLGMKK